MVVAGERARARLERACPNDRERSLLEQATVGPATLAPPPLRPRLVDAAGPAWHGPGWLPLGAQSAMRLDRQSLSSGGEQARLD